MSIDLEFEYFTFHSLDFDAGIDVSNLPKKTMHSLPKERRNYFVSHDWRLHWAHLWA